MSLNLPSPIASYFAADRAGDSKAFVRLFTENAIVIDERQTHTGRDEIGAWRAKASTQYSYTAEPVALDEQEGQTTVTAHLTGNFPGSPVDLRYIFTLDDDRIARLEITP